MIEQNQFTWGEIVVASVSDTHSVRPAAKGTSSGQTSATSISSAEPFECQ